MEKELSTLAAQGASWRKNAVAFTNRYIEEGLRDRALTRDLAWGIPVPRAGYEKRQFISGQRMCWAICLRVEARQRSKDSMRRLCGENTQNTIMCMAKIIYPFIQLFCRRCSLQMEKDGICQIRSYPVNT